MICNNLLNNVTLERIMLLKPFHGLRPCYTTSSWLGPFYPVALKSFSKESHKNTPIHLTLLPPHKISNNHDDPSPNNVNHTVPGRCILTASSGRSSCIYHEALFHRRANLSRRNIENCNTTGNWPFRETWR